EKKQGKDGNFQLETRRRSRWCEANQKDGHYIIGDQCERPGGDKEDSERSQSDIWSEIINATYQSEFFERLADLVHRPDIPTLL
ncbi:hypothetical protein, partial [Clostridium perfringens]